LTFHNFRYTCLVCNNRPIFDTVNVLYLHRQGKKHAENLEYFQQKKVELHELILKRKHDQFMLDGTTNIQQASVNHKGLGCGQAYDPRVKKKKITHRKLAVDLQAESRNDVAESNPSPYPDSTVAFRLSNKTSGTREGNKIKNNKMFREMILEQQREGPVKHCTQLKNIFRKEEDMSAASPYRSKRRHYEDSTDTHSKPQVPTINLPQSVPCSNTSDIKPGNSYISDNNNHSPAQSIPTTEVAYAELATSPPPPPEAPSTSAECSKVTEPIPDKVKETAKKYLQYRGAGWKKDLYGNWVKDEDAEFDSDEEPPDLP
ncbi:hypothetical protein FSP39_005523, partial [Pinctada imbricata]